MRKDNERALLLVGIPQSALPFAYACLEFCVLGFATCPDTDVVVSCDYTYLKDEDEPVYTVRFISDKSSSPRRK